jgi:peptide/nickel transport system substrate-binding protein
MYTTGADSNFGKISSPAVDKQAIETMGQLDAAKAREMANEVDKLIFAEGFSLPLFQSPGNVGVRSNLANFGPAGIGDIDYTRVGFMKP